jgi:acyl carrier protein
MIELYKAMADILEVNIDQLSPQFNLNEGEAPWDSLAIVSTIALLDELFNVTFDGNRLGGCETLGDIEALIKGAKK